MKNQNYMNVGPMFFTSIDQIINYLKVNPEPKKVVILCAIEALEEAKKQGYELQKTSPVPKELTPEDFERVERGEWKDSICEECYFKDMCCTDSQLVIDVIEKLGGCAGYVFKLNKK